MLPTWRLSTGSTGTCGSVTPGAHLTVDRAAASTFTEVANGRDALAVHRDVVVKENRCEVATRC